MTEPQLQLKLLGDLAVIRDGVTVPLPPSKKTRALLAWLAMNPRQFRREYLCELLWELPDDPRGSLRWSLSKIRGLVDTDHSQRIVADRNHIRFEPMGANVDVNKLHSVASADLSGFESEELENIMENCAGQFLEGLELTNCYTFHAWCISERDRVIQARNRLLKELLKRLQGRPQEALPFARAFAINAPYDESARATLIRLLVSSGRADEAEQQYNLGKRMLLEAGLESSGELFQAWRGKPGVTRSAASEITNAPQLRDPVSLAGREQEIVQLHAVITEALEQKHPNVLLLSGAPGIGKTRLLDVASQLGVQSGARIFGANAFEMQMRRPFSIWIDLLNRQSPEDVEKIFSNSDESSRDSLLEKLAICVSRHFKSGPLMMIFDDVQWWDESSATALGLLSRFMESESVVVLLAGRSSEMNDNNALQQVLRSLRSAGILTEIPLQPLSEEAIFTIIKDQATNVDAASLSSECAGNPLLAIELARAVATGGTQHSLDAVIRDRIAHFDLQTLDILHWAAVLSSRIDLDILNELTGLDITEIGRSLELAERYALLIPVDLGFRFSHELVAKSLYNEISPTRQRIMHRKVAELLQQRLSPELDLAADLAHHASLSGDTMLATIAMISAGRLNLRFFANRDAASFARKGLHLVSKLPERERVCLSLECHDILLAAQPADDWEADVTTYIELAEKALDHASIKHARLGYFLASHLRWSHGHWRSAREQSLQAERVTRGGTDKEHVIGMAEAARCLAMLEQDLERADAMLMEAAALAERNSMRVEAIASASGMLHYHENRLDEAEELFKQARTLAKATGDRFNEFQANEYLFMIDFERGNLTGAMKQSREILELGEKFREGSEAPFARALHGLCHYALQNDDTPLVTAARELREVDAKHRLAYTLTRAALLDVERGQFRKARQRATEALSYAETLERPTEILLANIALAEANRGDRKKRAYSENLDAIQALRATRVAAWAFKRASKLLDEESRT